MERKTRVGIYERIEQYRKRPLVVYATSTRQNVPAQMAGDAVREFIDQLDAIKTFKEVDILIHSTGGDALVAWKLMSMIRERFERVAVLVPFMAFSAATMFALGADQIVMHPNASLGPIDPQIAAQNPEGRQRNFAYEDLGAFLRFLGDEVGITEQEHLTDVVEKLFSVSDPLTIGAARRASDLSTQVGERLLSMHMDLKSDREKARQIALNLNKSFFAHGDAISRKRARELELKIAEDDVELETEIWQAFLGLEAYMQLRSPFQPLEHFVSDPAAAQTLAPRGALNLPANAPPQIQQQAWQVAVNAAIQNAQGQAPEVPYSVVNAVIESVRATTEFRSTGTISAFRKPDGNVQISLVVRESGWRSVT